MKDTRSSPLATSLTPRRPPWPFADWGDWGETCGSEAAPDVLCGLDSARTSNITGMYWGPMATTSGWSAGQPSMAKPSNHRGVQIWRQPQLRILVFNPPIEKVVLIEEDQLGKLANKSPRPGFLARSPLYLMVFTTLNIAMYSNVISFSHTNLPSPKALPGSMLPGSGIPARGRGVHSIHRIGPSQLPFQARTGTGVPLPDMGMEST